MSQRSFKCAAGVVWVRNTCWITGSASNEVHAIVEPEGYTGSDRDGKLLKRHQRPSQLWWRNFSLVERDDLGLVSAGE